MATISAPASRTMLIRKALSFFLRSRNLAAGSDDFGLAIDRHLRRAHERRDGVGRAGDLELLHQKRESVLERLADGPPDFLAHAPHPLLEGADRLLARLVDELLLGILRLPFLGRVLAHP